MGSQNPADQLREAMRDAAHESGAGNPTAARRADCPCIPEPVPAASRFCPTPRASISTPGCIAGITRRERTWDPLIPDEVNPPILKQGAGADPLQSSAQRPASPICSLEGRSGDTGARPRCLGRYHRLQLSAAARANSTAPISSSARSSSTTCARSDSSVQCSGRLSIMFSSVSGSQMLSLDCVARSPAGQPASLAPPQHLHAPSHSAVPARIRLGNARPAPSPCLALPCLAITPTFPGGL